MKNMKLFIGLVLVITLCMALVGCGNRPSSQNVGWDDSENPGNQEWLDPDNPEDQEWLDPDNPEDQEWIDEPSSTPGEPDQTGSYRHEIDGWVFYTEHNLDDWIRQGDFGETFYAVEMVEAIYGNAEIYKFGECTVEYYVSDSNAPHLYLVFENVTPGGSLDAKPGDGTVSRFSAVGHFVYQYDGYSRLYYMNTSPVKFPYELLEISLYVMEQASHGVENPLDSVTIYSSRFGFN